jgi:hypothetical protein
MKRFLSLAVLLIAALLAASSAHAQLFDPFRRPSPNMWPREAPMRAEPEIPAGENGITHTSTEQADAQRATQASEYILVFGDTLADNLAQGLADAFVADHPEVAVIRKTRASSGLVRADFYDWPAQVPGHLEKEKATAIALIIGANDQQVLRDSDGVHEFRSDRWREIYAKRVDEMLAKLAQKSVPVFVIGLPSMQNARLHSNMPYINEILRERAQAIGAYYIDIWEGFVDDGGGFIFTGPALDGQTRRLRLGDGVHFSRPGARKVAHYLERDLLRLFEQRAAGRPFVPSVRPDGTAPAAPSAASPSTPARPLAGPVLPLNLPAASGGQLAGAAKPANLPIDPGAAKVLVEGKPVEPVSGRADDFRWQAVGTVIPLENPQSVMPPVAPANLPPLQPEQGRRAPPGLMKSQQKVITIPDANRVR